MSGHQAVRYSLPLEMSPSGTVPVPFVTTHVRIGGIGCAETVTE